MRNVPQIRVFLASPGDVNEERAVALEVLDMLEYDPLFRKNGAGGVSIHAIAWDKPGSGTAMRVTMTPQTAIKQGMPRPSDCDIVLALFWGRMGTPLPHPEYQKGDGSAYLSGTEWEFWDAVNAERAHGKPITLIYRRTEPPPIKLDDDAALEQYRKVRAFFAQFRDPTTDALLGGVNEYATPEALRINLLTNLRNVIDGILSNEQAPVAASGLSTARPLVEAPPLWEGSPFPGLRAFTEKDTPIFFGRGLETSDLVRRIETNRFTAVIAASGSGKSSLVAAGLIPRLCAGAIISTETNSKDWRFVRLNPGGAGGPFATWFDALCDAFPEHTPSPFMRPQEKRAFIDSVRADPNALIEICDGLLKAAKAPEWAEILCFIDQFEELFTLVKPEERIPFVALLEAIHGSGRLRGVVTMRSDFYADCLELPTLAALLKDATYPLAAPTAGALYEMITRPAERAGLAWNDGLPGRILNDTGSEAGALALMAYALDGLYNVSQARADKRLSHEAYDAIGGVAGAIGQRAKTVFERLTLPDKASLLQRVFSELVVVDERGTATRQRAALGKFSADELSLIRAFADARLLVTDENEVEVAHEAVFRSWERLKAWIASAQEDLIMLRQVRSAANEWERSERNKAFLWPHERLLLAYAMQARLKPDLDEMTRDFLKPELDRLMDEINDPTTNHRRRASIGDRLAEIGDNRPGVGLRPDGLPDIAWCDVPGGTVTLEGVKGTFKVQPFKIAKYPVTYSQYKVFLDADDGYRDDRWWNGLKYEDQLGVQNRPTDNHPAENVSWFDAVAFCRWLTSKYVGAGLLPSPLGEGPGVRAEIRLPTEWEWQHAATGGNPDNVYPWGATLDSAKANTDESALNRTTAVGIYPHGAVAGLGILDMSGNVEEWCLIYINNKLTYGLRGGSWNRPLLYARAAVTGYDYGDQNARLNHVGFRVASIPS
ncbi:MAG: formylglycine-generating enzyme family protein [Aggregatilineales bacterium]